MFVNLSAMISQSLSKDESDGSQSKVIGKKRKRSANASKVTPGSLTAASPDSDTSAEMNNVEESVIAFMRFSKR